MDELDSYRAAIRRIIGEYASYKPSVGQIDTEVIFDRENDHYELIRVGWSGIDRVHGAVIHIDIRNGKIWIQHDGTPNGVAVDLLEAGIPKDRIVLAFRSPDMRIHTGFAVA